MTNSITKELRQKSAKDAAKAVIRAELSEAIAGYISSILKSVPFPLNLVLAAAGGALVTGLMDKALAKFAGGGDFVTQGPQIIMVGDNPGGKERVRVDPIGSPNLGGSGGGIVNNFYGPVFAEEDYVRNSLIPMIESERKHL